MYDTHKPYAPVKAVVFNRYHGKRYTVLRHNRNGSVTVRFEDGTIKTHRTPFNPSREVVLQEQARKGIHAVAMASRADYADAAYEAHLDGDLATRDHYVTREKALGGDLWNTLTLDDPAKQA